MKRRRTDRRHTKKQKKRPLKEERFSFAAFDENAQDIS